MTAEETLRQIADETKVCTRCPLYQGARNAVPGVGTAQAQILLIGEAPSQYDDRNGTPFSGPSGAFLDSLLALAGLSRAEVYLTNIVKHRVPESRALEPGEIAACADYLTRQIAAIDPLVVVALGSGALARFLPTAKISRIHGQAKLLNGRIFVAMYNPAAGLHREELRQTIEDDFRRALPAALAEAQRLAAEGKLGQSATGQGGDDASPQQLSLF